MPQTGSDLASVAVADTTQGDLCSGGERTAPDGTQGNYDYRRHSRTAEAIARQVA